MSSPNDQFRELRLKREDRRMSCIVAELREIKPTRTIPLLSMKAVSRQNPFFVEESRLSSTNQKSFALLRYSNEDDNVFL